MIILKLIACSLSFELSLSRCVMVFWVGRVTSLSNCIFIKLSAPVESSRFRLDASHVQRIQASSVDHINSHAFAIAGEKFFTRERTNRWIVPSGLILSRCCCAKQFLRTNERELCRCRRGFDRNFLNVFCSFPFFSFFLKKHCYVGEFLITLNVPWKVWKTDRLKFHF